MGKAIGLVKEQIKDTYDSIFLHKNSSRLSSVFTSRNWPNLQQKECKQKISKHVDSELS